MRVINTTVLLFNPNTEIEDIWLFEKEHDMTMWKKEESTTCVSFTFVKDWEDTYDHVFHKGGT